MKKFKVYSPDSPEETKMEKQHRALARKVAAESIVLLKNTGVLPLKTQKVALYGAGARMTIRGGAGSGDMRERYSVNIEEGLQNANVTITSKAWLDRFQSDYQKQSDDRRNLIEDKIKDYTQKDVLKMFEVIAAVPLKYPIGSKITLEEIPQDDTQNAIYVVARQAGEGHDRHVEKGDFLLDDVEVANIKLLAQKFKNLTVIVNCGSMIDLSPLDQIDNIGAILFVGQVGTEGGNAVADVLLGKVTPSGKLVDTWAKKYTDFPAAESYSYLGSDLTNADYTEGIYVGYRYFDTFNVAPRYPFGFGLSYTTFDFKSTSQLIKGSSVKVKTQVKNIGDTYSGKETIQLYISKPGIQVQSEKIALCAFEKTANLKPGETAELTLSFDLNDVAVFNEENALWLLEKGDYTLLLGDSSQNISPIAVLKVSQDIDVEKVAHICPKTRDFKELEVAKGKTHVAAGDVPSLTVDPAAFKLIEHSYQPSTAEPTAKTTEILNNLNIEDLVTLCVGGGQFDKYYNLTPGVAGNTTAALLEKGIPNINLSDGPAGLNVLTETLITPDGIQKFLRKIPDSNNWGFIRKMADYAIAKPQEGRPVYQFMTAWPAVVNQAQTWDPDLVKQIGSAIGAEMLEIGVSLWLAPAINIHRNPLCGRNFEYYSEDPYLTSVMASAVIEGVQSHQGVGVTVKHFCCNNQEENRDHMSANLSERTLREIYTKTFKFVVKHAQPKAVMSSYNKVNGVYTANNYDLLTKLLRNEFGFTGIVMTDWNAAAEGKADYQKCQTSGNDLIMPGYPVARESLLAGLKKGTIPEKAIKTSAIRILNLIFSSAVGEDF
ncbi:glycoside hydrolase family 3 N-terminal domain-containing protein [Liquorilactobacillus ghanensis]|uniref:glycoside hydrolase family 3 protein n=1 Tax=Liquorilactobacillus ghanensis TaxID=399370 RepID=UPI0039EB16F8